MKFSHGEHEKRELSTGNRQRIAIVHPTHTRRQNIPPTKYLATREDVESRRWRPMMPRVFSMNGNKRRWRRGSGPVTTWCHDPNVFSFSQRVARDLVACPLVGQTKNLFVLSPPLFRCLETQRRKQRERKRALR